MAVLAYAWQAILFCLSGPLLQPTSNIRDSPMVSPRSTCRLYQWFGLSLARKTDSDISDIQNKFG